MVPHYRFTCNAIMYLVCRFVGMALCTILQERYFSQFGVQCRTMCFNGYSLYRKSLYYLHAILCTKGTGTYPGLTSRTSTFP